MGKKGSYFFWKNIWQKTEVICTSVFPSKPWSKIMQVQVICTQLYPQKPDLRSNKIKLICTLVLNNVPWSVPLIFSCEGIVFFWTVKQGYRSIDEIKGTDHLILDQGFEDNRGYRSIHAIFVCFCVLLGFVNICCALLIFAVRCCALLCSAVLCCAVLS